MGVYEKKIDDPVDECLKISGRVSCSAVRIYDLIREVGSGKLSADNALHQLVEDYHELHVASSMLRNLAHNLEGKEL